MFSESYNILVLSRLLYNTIFILNDIRYGLDLKGPICENFNKWIELFYKYLEKRLNIEDGHVKHSSLFANHVSYFIKLVLIYSNDIIRLLIKI